MIQVKNIKQISRETEIYSENNTYKFEKSIIACGALKKLTDQPGENIPLDTERGYHVHFEGMIISLKDR